MLAGARNTAAKDIRGPLGETVSSIEKFSAPVEQATTSSLEALKAYSMGDEKRAREGDLVSMPFYKRAVELDPNFAMAYARLGAVYGNLGEVSLAEQNAQKAFDRRDRVSEARKVLHHRPLLQRCNRGDARKRLRTMNSGFRPIPETFRRTTIWPTST